MHFKLIRNYLIERRQRTPSSHTLNFTALSPLLTLGLLLCLACGNLDRTSLVATSPEDAAEQLPSGEGLDIGAIAPEFSLPDGDGNVHRLSEYRGQKLVIVFYRTGT